MEIPYIPPLQTDLPGDFPSAFPRCNRVEQGYGHGKADSPLASRKTHQEFFPKQEIGRYPLHGTAAETTLTSPDKATSVALQRPA
ncbi:hypothetical protein [Salinicola sp. CR57]|uniref:hypothetical protein n=1 Tax=Salinicola sp. CR57 TaxID=1949086 RepID=UPI0013008FFF|nr:hypothetical protein [Salinicola sp. CR57]